MSRKVLLVNTSPRKGGNSEAVITLLEEQIREKLGDDADITVFHMRTKRVGFCLACDACQHKDHQMCVQHDDMTDLLPTIEQADAIVLATPVYNRMLSAQATTFIDRFYPFFKEGDPMWSNSTRREKHAAVIAVSWGKTGPAYTALAEDAAKGFCQVGASKTRGLSLGEVKERGDLAKHPEHIQALCDLATWLVQEDQ